MTLGFSEALFYLEAPILLALGGAEMIILLSDWNPCNELSIKNLKRFPGRKRKLQIFNHGTIVFIILLTLGVFKSKTKGVPG